MFPLVLLLFSGTRPSIKSLTSHLNNKHIWYKTTQLRLCHPVWNYHRLSNEKTIITTFSALPSCYSCCFFHHRCSERHSSWSINLIYVLLSCHNQYPYSLLPFPWFHNAIRRRNSVFAGIIHEKYLGIIASCVTKCIHNVGEKYNDMD